MLINGNRIYLMDFNKISVDLYSHKIFLTDLVNRLNVQKLIYTNFSYCNFEPLPFRKSLFKFSFRIAQNLL